VAFKTSPCFVDSVWEVFAPLLAGATLVVVPHSVMRDAQQVGCLHTYHCRAAAYRCKRLWVGRHLSLTDCLPLSAAAASAGRATYHALCGRAYAVAGAGSHHAL
jgi:hypothetical protein